MKTFLSITFIAILMFSPAIPTADASEHAFGIGAHYFYSLDDIREDLEDEFGDSFHRDGLALTVSYRFKPNDHFGIAFEVQAYPDGYYDAESAYSPRLMMFLGKSLYIGGGVAVNYVDWEDDLDFLHDTDDWSDPYYLLRAGLEFPFIVDDLKLYIDASYEFNEWNEVEEFDSDTITFGAGIRFSL